MLALHTGFLLLTLAATAQGPRVAEFGVDVQQRTDAFDFGHDYADRSLEFVGMAGYEPTGRSELSWEDLSSTYTEMSVGIDLPSGRRIRVRGGRGEFRTGVVEDLDYGASGGVWSHSTHDASAGGVTSGSITTTFGGASGPYWGVGATRWDLHLDGGRDLLPGTRNQVFAANASTYDARRYEALLGTEFDRPIGSGRIRWQGGLVGGAGWMHSEAHWGLRNLDFSHDGLAFSGEARLGLGVALGESGRFVLDASAGGTYVPSASGSEERDGLTRRGGGIAITATHWTVGGMVKVGF